LNTAPAPARIVSNTKAVLKETAKAYIVSSKDFSAAISKTNGALDSYTFRGRPLIAKPLVPNFWRALTDRERDEARELLAVWRGAGPQRKLEAISAETLPGGEARISAHFSLAGGLAKYALVYTVRGDGEIDFDITFDPSEKLPYIPRIGMQMEMPGKYRFVKWFGRGPEESYRDRKAGYAVGIYSANVDKMNYMYVEPEDTGNRMDVRWVAITDKSGFGLRAEGMPLINFSAWPYTMEDIEKTDHDYLLPREKNVTVNLDYMQLGMNSDYAGKITKENPYFIFSGQTYKYSFRLLPTAGGKAGR